MERPYVIINCAMSVDGKIALKTRKQTRISSDEDLKRVHELRESADAVLVGIGTVLSDDPGLKVKEEYLGRPPKRQPIRVVLDAKFRIPETAKLLDGSAKTIIFVAKGLESFRKVTNAEVIGVSEERDGILNLREVLRVLKEKGVQKLLVEGGGTVIWEFIREGLFDDLYVYIGSMVIGGRDSPTMAEGEGASNYNEIIRLKLIDVRRLGDGVLLHYKKIGDNK
ncbi:MAG: 2,5-diamino-6-(ribosylamino)-4(3H)-pyrimidinone 5'-phosphate reductase [Thermoplasmata archaeon]|nr:2,5-diamino-6-(ribosylamino)-4(3H)-pyrimidinone 5'-phosphate reductase [Euryarchaeota archaeon]RLF65783.1 MAG: 2,5-diamino-6-(ribosylamino)-4(3H)-pyrimidinone 5'-phosphate reductase [Thermoplasmata archaeon]